jgi:hypothetical protein
MHARHLLFFVAIFSPTIFAKKHPVAECSVTSEQSSTDSTSGSRSFAKSSKDESSSDSTSESDSSNVSHSSSLSSLDSSSEEKLYVLKEPRYDYFSDAFIKALIERRSRYVLVATGWSESSLGKMGPKNAQKQKRAFPMSYLLADRINNLGGDAMIIYQTTAKINKDYRKYLFYTSHRDELQGLPEADINAIVAEFEANSFAINFLDPSGRDKNAEDVARYLYTGKNAYKSIKVPKILNAFKTRGEYQSSTIVGFTAHFSGPHLERHAQEMKLPYLVNPSSQAYRIKKSESRKSFRDAGVRHPRGSYNPAFTLNRLTRDIYRLLMQIPVPKIVLKLDESAGGYGNKVMTWDNFDKNMKRSEAYAVIKAKFDDVEKFPPAFKERIAKKNGGAIVEEFIQGKGFSSPASVYMITGEDKVSVRYTYDQLLGGVDNQDFKGSLGPIPLLDDPSSNIVLMSEKVGLHLSKQGVRGNVGTDFVIITNEHGERVAYAIENNVRNTGTSYPYNALQMLVGQEALQPKFMKAFDDVQIPLITTPAFLEKAQEQFYHHLRNDPLSFNKNTVRGCLVHHDTFSIGKIGVVCVADSLQEAQTMFDEFTNSAVDFIQNLDVTKSHQRYLNQEKKTFEIPKARNSIRFELEDDLIYVEEAHEIGEKRIRFVF